MDKPCLWFIEGRYAICRLGSGEAIPSWAFGEGFFSVTRTQEELSVVCDEKRVPQGVLCGSGYVALKVQGPLDFSLTGILSSISAVLAGKGVSIFAISTYDTDYILIRQRDKTAAADALKKVGYTVWE